MVKRKSISASLRWSVYARDGFSCRYCGAQAGQDGIELAVDHLVSVADGGDNSATNLITSCRRCNSGKGARSLHGIPSSKDVIRRIKKMASNLQDQLLAISETLVAQKEVEQQIINMKCEAYGVDIVQITKIEKNRVSQMIKQYGADRVFEWYRITADYGVEQSEAIKYIYGIIRRKKESGEI